MQDDKQNSGMMSSILTELGVLPPEGAASDVKPASIPIKDRPVSGSEDYPLGQPLRHQMDHAQRGDFDAGKEKADNETVTTDAAACRKRDQLP